MPERLMNASKSLHLLLLEDDAGDALLVQEILRATMPGELNCTHVYTLGEVLDQLRTAPFDVILLDLDLPDSQGLNTFLRVHAEAHAPPILILTGLADQRLALQAIRAGAQDYIVKSQLVSNPLARAIRYAIERHHLQAELYSISMQDSLTELCNRRAFLMLAEEQFKLIPRSQQGLLLFLFDVDGLKSINDAFGHTQGDKALIDTAIILRLTFRSSDIIARLSGDEFVVLAMGTLPATAELLQARLETNLNTHNATSNRHYELSLSMGVAYVDPNEQVSTEELISKADQEMYAHKRLRRKAQSI